uniref:Vitellogenin domain-containing protein n=1 Tax=Oryzias sinensis TaxID=183150 RepID=A0A8C7WTY2_9TELE
MRAVVLALSLALVGATVLPEFSAGKTYVYKYEMSVINGLPEEGLARAKMNASCKFLISAFDKNTYMLKVEDVTMQEFTGIWPKEHAESVGNIPKAFTPEFNIPIKFEYSSGVVGKVFYEFTNDFEWTPLQLVNVTNEQAQVLSQNASNTKKSKKS